ncbi:MAG: hypothetical protein ACJAY8_001092 [Sphingobacteriales bacterium]|jgi:hypothetical protein
MKKLIPLVIFTLFFPLLTKAQDSTLTLNPISDTVSAYFVDTTGFSDVGEIAWPKLQASCFSTNDSILDMGFVRHDSGNYIWEPWLLFNYPADPVGYDLVSAQLVLTQNQTIASGLKGTVLDVDSLFSFNLIAQIPESGDICAGDAQTPSAPIHNFSFKKGNINIADVKDVLDGLTAGSNYHFRIRPDYQAMLASLTNAEDSAQFSFYSGQFGNAISRPQLILQYNEEPPAPCTGIRLDSLKLTRVGDCTTGNSDVDFFTCGENGPFEFAINGGAFQKDSNFTKICPGDLMLSVKDTLGTVFDTTVTIGGYVFEVDSVKVVPDLCSNGKLNFADCTNEFPFEVGIIATGNDTIWIGIDLTNSPSLVPGNYIFYMDKPCTAGSSQMAFPVIDPGNDPTVEYDRIASCDEQTSDITVKFCSVNKPLLFGLDGGALQLDSSFLNVPVGTHQIVVVDSKDDTAKVTIDLNAIAVEIKDVVITEDLCGGTSKITAGSCGGEAPFIFQITNDQGDTIHTQVGTLSSGSVDPGQYTIHLSDNQGDKTTKDVVVNPSGNGFQSEPSVDVVQPTCDPLSDGQIVFTNTELDLQFSINNGASYTLNKTFSNLASGVYSLRIKKESCVSETKAVTLASTYDLKVDAVTLERAPSCSPTKDGIVKMTVSGGEKPYSYSPVGGFLTPNSEVKTLPGDSLMSFYATDAKGCLSDTLQLQLTYTGKIAIEEETVVDASCDPFTDGSAKVVGTPGKKPLQIHWIGDANYGTVFEKTNLPDTIMRYVVRDASGCLSDTGKVTIVNSGKLRLPNISVKAVGCAPGALGEVALGADGGNPGNYEYTFNNGAVWGVKSDSIDLAFGATLVVKARSGTCESDPYTINIDSVSIVDTSSIAVKSVLCPGNEDGEITVNVIGAVGEIEYSLGGGTRQSSNVFSNLAYQPGGFLIAVFSDNQCDASIPKPRTSTNFRVFMNDVGGVNVTGYAKDLITCRDGTDGVIVINASGNEGPFTYSVDNGVTYLDTNVIENLGPGFYQMKVKDAKGCESKVYGTILENPVPVTFGNLALVSPTCFETTDGSITIGAYGGSKAFDFSIDSGLTYFNNNAFGSLKGGIYHVTVADTNGCDTINTAVELFRPDSLEVQVLDVVLPDCANPIDGEIQIDGIGGTKPYVYEKEFAPISNTGVFTDLVPKIYRFRIRDIKACKSAWDTVVMPDPVLPEIDSVFVRHISCFGETDGQFIVVQDNPSGITYAIDNQGFQQSPVFFNLQKGVHRIKLRNAFGCESEWMDITIEEPELVELIGFSVLQEIICFGDSATILLEGMGGRLPYTYFIQDNFVNSNDSGEFKVNPGNFKGWIEDVNGCRTPFKDLSIAGVPEVVMDPFVVHQTAGSLGRIISNVTGGVEPYMHKIDTFLYQPDKVFDSLVQGTYTLYVEDANGCGDSIVVVVNGPTGLQDLESISLSIAPNPSSGKFHILGLESENPVWIVSDLKGSIIAEGSGKIIDLNSHLDGAYIIRIRWENHFSNHIILKGP